jgi:predicted nucleic acid-binding protein
MTAWVIDTSVLVKLFVDEEGSGEAAASIKPTDELFAPDLIWAEVGNVLWKYARRGDLTADDVEAIVADMLQMPIKTTESSELVGPALEIALETGRTVYDAMYLALAVERNACLLTADETLVNGLANTRFAQHLRHTGQQR